MKRKNHTLIISWFFSTLWRPGAQFWWVSLGRMNSAKVGDWRVTLNNEQTPLSSLPCNICKLKGRGSYETCRLLITVSLWGRKVKIMLSDHFKMLSYQIKALLAEILHTCFSEFTIPNWSSKARWGKALKLWPSHTVELTVLPKLQGYKIHRPWLGLLNV